MIIKKNKGFTLIEIILSVVIAAIVFVIGGVFVGGTVQLAANISRNTANSVANIVALNIIDADFANYKTGSNSVQITTTATLVTVKFSITPNNTYIQYQCNYSTAKAYRVVGVPASNEVFLNNVSSCTFITYKSKDSKTVFIDVTFVITRNGQSTTLSKVLSAPV